MVTFDAGGHPVDSMLNGVVSRTDFVAYASWAKTGDGAPPGVATGGG